MKFTNKMVAAAVALMATGTAALADPPTLETGTRVDMEVPLHKSEVIDLQVPVTKISVGNPDIADILIMPQHQLYVVGKKLGSTNVVLWNGDERVVRTINVDVTHDLQALKAKLHELMPDEKIGVYEANDTIGLTGEVSSAARVATAMDVAKSFLGSDSTDKNGGAKVLNMLQVGGSQQVMLQVQVAEVSRSLIRQLGIKFHALTTGGNLTMGAVAGGGTLLSGTPSNIVQPVTVNGSAQLLHIPLPGEGQQLPTGSTEFVPNPLTIDNHGFLGSFMDGTTLFNIALDAAQENGLAKVLAEPTLTTMTGQEATFHAGGEFPVPMYSGPNQGTTIVFKEFGINLGFIPVVLDSGTINLKVNIRVSELSNQNAVTVNIPQTGTAFFVNSLTSRSATSTIELGNGQTMGIAGLIDENLREQVSKFPGLGDLPVIGALFRSQEFVKGQTELVILVTPNFAKPNRRDAYRLPTATFVDPNAVDFYLLGRMEGKDERKDKKGAPAPAREMSLPETGGAEGTFGQKI